jgi:hypothetical protein
MLTIEEVTEYFLRQMENAPTLAELEKIGAEIKGWRDFLYLSYESNKQRLTQTGGPEDILKKNYVDKDFDK